MHHTLSLVITQELAAILRARARAEGFVDIRHFCRDLLFKAGELSPPADAPQQPSRLPPTQHKILRALKESGKPMCVADFIRATGFSHQACHLNVKALVDEGLLTVAGKHSDGTPGAPKRFLAATEAGLARLAQVDAARKAEHDALQRRSEESAIAVGAAPDAIDQQEAEELRAVRARHEQRRQREQEWAELDPEAFNRCQMAMLRLAFARLGNLEAAKAKAPSFAQYIKDAFMSGKATPDDLYTQAMDEMDQLPGGADGIRQAFNVAAKMAQQAQTPAVES